jgi:hypothetical protein
MAKHTDNEEHPTSKGFTIEPPPQETGPEPLYRVVYMIDINANNPKQAAERAHALMRDGQSMPPVLDILDPTGRCAQVDLSEP